MMGMRREAIFITQWKDEMKERLKLRFKGRELSEKKVDKDALLKEKELLLQRLDEIEELLKYN